MTRNSTENPLGWHIGENNSAKHSTYSYLAALICPSPTQLGDVEKKQGNVFGGGEERGSRGQSFRLAVQGARPR